MITAKVNLKLENKKRCQGVRSCKGRVADKKLPAAKRDNCQEIIALLRKAGAGWLEAVKAGNLDVVNSYISAGVDENTVDKDRQTALIIASSKGYTGIVTVLIAKGANTEARDIKIFVPLVIAARDGRMEIVKVLVEEGNAQCECYKIVGAPRH